MKKVMKKVRYFLSLLRHRISRLIGRKSTNQKKVAENHAAPATHGHEMPLAGRQETAPAAEPDRKRQSAVLKRKTDSVAASRQRIVCFNEQFLDKHYELRYNMLKGITEVRSKSGGGDVPWQPLRERDLNRLTVEQLKAGGESWSYGMKLCIDSSIVPDYNPVASYLANCPPWDGHDHIGDMARRVPTSYDRWPEFFHRWMLGLTAQALGVATGPNSLVPMLIGPQGTRKSTFCRSILPPEMREYYADDIKMDNAEQVERVLGRMWLVCIDEYDSKTQREQAKIKRLLTESDVQVRRMRSDQYTLTRRLASFIATTNDHTPLSASDGTRRYLCVEVEGIIDMQGDINWPQMFAQSQAELKQEGCRYWFNDEDEQEIQEHNRPFQQLSSIESLLPTFFEAASERSSATLWQVNAIQKELATVLRPQDVPTLTRLSVALKAMHWPQGCILGRRGYYLHRKEQDAPCG